MVSDGLRFVHAAPQLPAVQRALAQGGVGEDLAQAGARGHGDAAGTPERAARRPSGGAAAADRRSAARHPVCHARDLDQLPSK